MHSSEENSIYCNVQSDGDGDTQKNVEENMENQMKRLARSLMWARITYSARQPHTEELICQSAAHNAFAFVSFHSIWMVIESASAYNMWFPLVISHIAVNHYAIARLNIETTSSSHVTIISWCIRPEDAEEKAHAIPLGCRFISTRDRCPVRASGFS